MPTVTATLTRVQMTFTPRSFAAVRNAIITALSTVTLTITPQAIDSVQAGQMIVSLPTLKLFNYAGGQSSSLEAPAGKGNAPITISPSRQLFADGKNYLIVGVKLSSASGKESISLVLEEI